MAFLYLAGAVVCIFIFLIFVVCAFKESNVTGLHKALGVYGRFRAYLFVDLLFCGVGMVLILPAVLITTGSFSLEMLAAPIGGIICIMISIVLYRTALSRCPIQLKDDLFKNMLISGFGVAMKMAVFIFPVVWQLATPRFREVIDSNGNKLLVDSTGTVYSYGGNRIGEMIDDNKYVKY